MIDARRWILVEAWLALGLRLEWMSSWEAEGVPRDEWMEDDEEGCRYLYDGDRTWKVLDEQKRWAEAARPTAPRLGVAALRHELAHYLTASADQRCKRNFGLTKEDTGEENVTLLAEQAIDAILSGAAHVAELALRGRS